MTIFFNNNISCIFRAILTSSTLTLSVCAFAQLSGGLPPIQGHAIQNQKVDTAHANQALPPAAPKPDELIRSLQENLNKMGYNAGLPDGFWGPQTEAAVNAAQKAFGLPITGKPDTKLVSALKNNPILGAIPNSSELLNDHKRLDYSSRVKKYKNEIGRSIQYVKASMLGELSSPFFTFPEAAYRIEQSQTWWDTGNNVTMVFHNSTDKSLSGLVFKIYGNNCNSSEKKFYRFVKFSSEVRSNEITAISFPWSQDLPTGWRCIDVVDVILK